MGDEVFDYAPSGVQTIQDIEIETTGRLAAVSTRMHWAPGDIREPLLDFLVAWDEPRDPLHPLYVPENYGNIHRGLIHQDAFNAVPFIVALGGLGTKARLITPERFHEVAATFQNNVDIHRTMDHGEMRATIDATRRALRVVEALGYTSYLEVNYEARATIKESCFFDRRILKTILSPS